MADSKEAAKAATSNGVAIRPFEKMVEGMRAQAGLDRISAFEIASKVLDAMAEADDWDAIVDAQSTMQTVEDYFGQPLNVTEVAFSKASEKFKDGGLGVYINITGFVDTGEPFVFNTGAPNVCGALYRAQLKGLISEDKPLRMKIVPKEAGNGTLYLVGKA